MPPKGSSASSGPPTAQDDKAFGAMNKRKTNLNTTYTESRRQLDGVEAILDAHNYDPTRSVAAFEKRASDLDRLLADERQKFQEKLVKVTKEQEATEAATLAISKLEGQPISTAFLSESKRASMRSGLEEVHRIQNEMREILGVQQHRPDHSESLEREREKHANTVDALQSRITELESRANKAEALAAKYNKKLESIALAGGQMSSKDRKSWVRKADPDVWREATQSRWDEEMAESRRLLALNPANSRYSLTQVELRAKSRRIDFEKLDQEREEMLKEANSSQPTQEMSTERISTGEELGLYGPED